MGVHEREREAAFQVEQLGQLWRLWSSEVAVAEHLVEVLRHPTPPQPAARSAPRLTDSIEDKLARHRERLAELRCLWDDPLALARQLLELQLKKGWSDRSRAAELRELGWPIVPLVPEAQPAPLQLAAAGVTNRADRSPRPGFAGSRAGLPRSNGSKAAPTRGEAEVPRRWRLRASLAVLLALGAVALLLDITPIDPFGSPGVATWSPPALLSVLLGALAVILLAPAARLSGRRRRERDHGD